MSVAPCNKLDECKTHSHEKRGLFHHESRIWPHFLNKNCFMAFHSRQSYNEVGWKQCFPLHRSEGQERQLRCEQSNASKLRQQVQHTALKPKRCQRLRVWSPWAPPVSAQAGSSPGRGSLWIWARIGFYSTLVITRGNNAWHILWRLTVIFNPNFIKNFDLSLADNTTGGRTLCPIEISDTESTIIESGTSLQPLTCSWFFKGDSQHYHCTPKTSSEALKLVFLNSYANIWKLMCLHGVLLKVERKHFKFGRDSLWIYVGFFFPMQKLLKTRKLKDTLAEIHLTLYSFRTMGFSAL